MVEKFFADGAEHATQRPVGGLHPQQTGPSVTSKVSLSGRILQILKWELSGTLRFDFPASAVDLI